MAYAPPLEGFISLLAASFLLISIKTQETKSLDLHEVVSIRLRQLEESILNSSLLDKARAFVVNPLKRAAKLLAEDITSHNQLIQEMGAWYKLNGSSGFEVGK